MDKTDKPSAQERKIMSRYFIDWLVHDVMNGVDEDDLLHVPTDPKTGKPVAGVVFHKGRKLEKEQVVKLYQEAQIMIESQLWKQIIAEMKHHSNELMRRAKTEDDLYMAKTLLYTTDLLQKTVIKFMV